MSFESLPALNASLNALAALLLVAGLLLVRQRKRRAHRRVMTTAFAVSCLFLLLYLVHKASRGFENTTFHAEGPAKVAYLVLLASHVTLAMTVPVMAILLLRWGSQGRLQAHRRLARFAWPIWMYVSVTGVLIYLLLYPWNPAPPGPPPARALDGAERPVVGLAAPGPGGVQAPDLP